MPHDDERPDPSPAPDPPQDDHPAPARHLDAKWRSSGIALGVVMMAASIALSVVIPSQSDMLYIGNRAFMAIGGALASGGALGFLRIEVAMAKQTVSAGGGLAVLVFLYTVNPPAEVAERAQPPSRQVEFDEIDRLAGRIQTPDGAAPAIDAPRLEDLVRDEGFRSVRHFRVTATPEEIRQIERRLQPPQ